LFPGFAGAPASINATAPAGGLSFGGFSTTPSSAVAAAVASAAPSQGPDDEDADVDPEKNKTEKAVANQDANVEVTFEATCKVYNFRDEEGKAKEHAFGFLKLERNKQTGKCQAVVVRGLETSCYE
jgi:hypothetical protein